MLSRNNSRVAIGMARSISTTSELLSNSKRSKPNHYDVLGITPKATQGDIKTAYYKLSKVYHPDTAPDEKSAQNFREITEAYKVLGNLNSKKMYDKGLLGSTRRIEYQPEPPPTDPTLRFYKSRATRSELPGKQYAYDFDAWSKEHYGSVFEKQRYERETLRKRAAVVADMHATSNQEIVIYAIFATAFLIIVVTGLNRSDYDKPVIKKGSDDSETDPKDIVQS